MQCMKIKEVGEAHYIYLHGSYFKNFWNDSVKPLLTSTVLNMKKVSWFQVDFDNFFGLSLCCS